MNNLIITWLLALMTQVAPPDRLAAAPQFHGWEETATEKTTRYQDIATDLFQVAFDPSEHPVFAGRHGRARTAALLLALAFKESGFAKDVDKGPCVKQSDRCDGGRSACLLQVQIGEGITREGYTQADLFADRKKCFSAGLHIVQRSFKACHQEGADALLDVFTAGRCGYGRREGKVRLALGQRFFDQGHPKEADTIFLLPESATDSVVSLLEPR